MPPCNIRHTSTTNDLAQHSCCAVLSYTRPRTHYTAPPPPNTPTPTCGVEGLLDTIPMVYINVQVQHTPACETHTHSRVNTHGGPSIVIVSMKKEGCEVHVCIWQATDNVRVIPHMVQIPDASAPCFINTWCSFASLRVWSHAPISHSSHNTWSTHTFVCTSVTVQLINTFTTTISPRTNTPPRRHPRTRKHPSREPHPAPPVVLEQLQDGQHNVVDVAEPTGLQDAWKSTHTHTHTSHTGVSVCHETMS
jgi:hypothetical protein